MGGGEIDHDGLIQNDADERPTIALEGTELERRDGLRRCRRRRQHQQDQRNTWPHGTSPHIEMGRSAAAGNVLVQRRLLRSANEA